MVGLGVLDTEFEDVEPIVDLEVFAHVLHVERIELGLCLAQRSLHLARLQYLMRMIGRNAQRLSSIYDILAQTQRERGDTLVGLFVADGVVVDRPQHTREVGVEAVAILVAHHLLQYHRHLLLVYHVARGGHVCLGVAVEYRGIYALDGTRQHLQHGILVGEIGYHVGRVDAGEGLIVCVFEQR